MSNEIMTISGVSCYEKNGTAFLDLEAVARGLGFTQTKNSVEYVKWERVSAYLSELGFSPEVGKDGYIPENIFYRLAMKAKNETAEKFQALVADEIIPSIRKTGGYISGQETMSDSELKEVTAEEMQKIVDERKPEITKAIREELSKKVNYTKFVDAFIGNISSAINNSWVPKIEINFDKRKDD